MGLKNHSEIGWVLREYNDLIASAAKLGIKAPDSYYADGKIKGKSSRDKNIEGQKAPEKATPVFKKSSVVDPKTDLTDQIEEVSKNIPYGKPSLNEFPGFMQKGKASEIPGLLQGFKGSKRR